MKKLLIFVLVIFIPTITFADTTGEVFPSAGATVSESPWSDNSWSTPTNIFSDNASTASVTSTTFDSGDQTYVLKASGFDFSSIPSGSTINGITVRVNAWADSTLVKIDLCELLNTSGAKVGTNNCSTPVALNTTDSIIYTLGSSSDTWGNSLTTAWIQDSSFGVALGGHAYTANSQIRIDYVTIEVDYTPPLVAPAVTTDAGSTVGNTALILDGNITATGGDNATVRGFAWGTDSNLSGGDTSTTTESGSFGSGSFAQSLLNLVSDTVYYYRAYATNSAGTGYGSAIENLTTGVDNTPNRVMRLFQGYILKLLKGSRIIIRQS